MNLTEIFFDIMGPHLSPHIVEWLYRMKTFQEMQEIRTSRKCCHQLKCLGRKICGRTVGLESSDEVRFVVPYEVALMSTVLSNVLEEGV